MWRWMLDMSRTWQLHVNGGGKGLKDPIPYVKSTLYPSLL